MNAIKILKRLSGLTNDDLSRLLTGVGIEIKPTTIQSRTRSTSGRATLNQDQMRQLATALGNPNTQQLTELLNDMVEARKVIDELIYVGGVADVEEPIVTEDDFDERSEPIVTEDDSNERSEPVELDDDSNERSEPVELDDDFEVELDDFEVELDDFEVELDDDVSSILSDLDQPENDALDLEVGDESDSDLDELLGDLDGAVTTGVATESELELWEDEYTSTSKQI